jgi:phosphatidylglycerophosphate synthase
VDEPTRQGGGPALIEARSSSTEAIAVIAPPDAGAGSVSPATVVAGLPLLRRLVVLAERAGWKSFVVGCRGLAAEPSLRGTSAEALTSVRPWPDAHPRRVLFLPLTVIPQADWLRRLREMPIEPEQLYAFDAGVMIVETAESGAILTAAAGWDSTGEAVTALRAHFKTVDRSGEPGERFALTSAGDLPAAETWLLRSLIKPNEGVMSRHFERHISLAITRRLCRTSITPNAMTVVSLLIGFASAPFFLSSAAGYQLAGALLFLAHSILDGCDGELARLKFLESRWGAVMDVVGDNLVHAAVFSCMAMGWSMHLDSDWPLVLGGVVIVSTLSIAAIVFGRGMRASTDSGPSSAVSRIADVAVYRDFIYVIVFLAAFGKAHWFVAISAVGAPLFLLLLAWLGRGRS